MVNLFPVYDRCIIQEGFAKFILPHAATTRFACERRFMYRDAAIDPMIMRKSDHHCKTGPLSPSFSLSLPVSLFIYTVHYRYLAVYFPKNLTKDALYLARKGDVWSVHGLSALMVWTEF